MSRLTFTYALTINPGSRRVPDLPHESQIVLDVPTAVQRTERA